MPELDERDSLQFLHLHMGFSTESFLMSYSEFEHSKFHNIFLEMEQQTKRKHGLIVGNKQRHLKLGFHLTHLPINTSYCIFRIVIRIRKQKGKII